MDRIYRFFSRPSQLLPVIIGLVFLSLFVLHFSRAAVSAPLPPDVHCSGTDDTFQCEKTHVETMTRVFGVKAAMDDLKGLYAKDPTIVANCHQLTHVVGNTIIDVEGGNIAKAFTQGDSFCWSGYYHGVVERTVQKIGKDQFLANANTLCAAIPGRDRYSFDYYNCVHGLGHGLMAISENDLFAALPLCDKLSGDWEKNSCYGGVFMENVMTDFRNHYTKFLKKDDLLYPCDAVDAKYKEQCYLMQTSYALAQTNYDFSKVFTLCADADPAYRDTCAQSAGRDASGSTVSNAARTTAICTLAVDDRQETNCIIGAVKDFISYFHGGGEAHAFCLGLSAKFRDVCLSTASSYLATL